MNFRLSPRDELIVELLVIVLLVVLAVMFLILPQYRHIGEIKNKQDEVRVQVQEAETTLARLKEAKAEAVENQAELMKIANEMPDQPQMPTLIVEIQNVANQAGVDFISITPATPEEVGAYSIVPLQLSLTGQFRDVVDFLGRLYSMPRIVRVETVSIAVQEWPTLTMELGAQTYVMGDPLAPTEEAPPAPGAEGAGGGGAG